VYFEGIGEIVMEEGSCMYQEPGIKHSVLEYSDDFTVIEITIPADFETVSHEEPRAAESFHAAMTTTRPRHRVVNQGAEQ
jgi:hypothetical protein